MVTSTRVYHEDNDDDDDDDEGIDGNELFL